MWWAMAPTGVISALLYSGWRTNYLAIEATNGTANAAASVVGDNTSNNGSSPGVA